MAKSKLVKANEKIAERVVGGYTKIESGVVGAYKKIEDKFVDSFLTHDGESVEDAKKRLSDERKEHEEAAKVEAEKHTTDQQGGVSVGTDIGKLSVEASREIANASINASRNAGKRD